LNNFHLQPTPCINSKEYIRETSYTGSIRSEISSQQIDLNSDQITQIQSSLQTYGIKLKTPHGYMSLIDENKTTKIDLNEQGTVFFTNQIDMYISTNARMS
jgi:hypothetical protein